MLLYLHGFRSSPQSLKARLIGERCRELGRSAEYRCPQLPPSPAHAAALIESIAREAAGAPLTVVGSSLGGYYATWLAERIDCRCVLLNPAVRPQRDLARHLGVQTVYHSDATIEVKPSAIGELEALWVDAITRPERYLLIAAKGDELLDWHEMVARYPQAHQLVLEGSDHGLSDFASYVDTVLSFAQMLPVERGVGGSPAAGLAADSAEGRAADPRRPDSGGRSEQRMGDLPASVRRLVLALADKGVNAEVVMTASSARTAEEAAQALGVSVAQIAKSLIFKARASARAVLVLAAGDHRVDLAKVAALVGEPVERASADFVRRVTGYAIGGVAPLGYPEPVTCLCDETLRRFPVVWAAAGSPHAVFPIAPGELFRLTGGQVADIRLV